MKYLLHTLKPGILPVVFVPHDHMHGFASTFAVGVDKMAEHPLKRLCSFVIHHCIAYGERAHVAVDPHNLQQRQRFVVRLGCVRKAVAFG